MDKSKNLSIAYEMKKRSGKKKFAKGGEVNESAKSEQRPMSSEEDKDSKMVGRNSGNKSPGEDSWGDNTTVKQAQKPSITKLSQPKIVGSGAFTVRSMNQRDENNNQGDSFYPESDKAQPKQRYNEEGADRQGPEISDKESQHNNKKAAYEQASESQYSEDVADDNMKKVQSPLGRYAEGGSVEDEMMDVPTEEADEERHSSLAAAIMAKKDRMKEILDSGSMDEDEAMRYYEGGQVEGSDESEVDLDLNSMEQPNKYYGRNENEVLKENYASDMEDMEQPEDSNEHGDEIDSDKHDMISQIRSKMSKQRQFKVR